MSRPTHPDPERVYCCPECGGAHDIWEREWKEGGVRTTEEDRIACYDCGAEFGEPNVRQAFRPDLAVAADGGGSP